MEEGEIEVDSILPITLRDVTPELARDSGFKGVVDLLKIAKHGSGENVYLVRFHYISPSGKPAQSSLDKLRQGGVASRRDHRRRPGSSRRSPKRRTDRAVSRAR